MDTLLPLLLSVMQMGSGCADSYTTELCIMEGNRAGIPVYESNPIYTVPFGDQPPPAAFVLSDVVSVAAMYGVGWLLRRTPARGWWFVPQVALVGIQVWQTSRNYNLYKRIRARAALER